MSGPFTGLRKRFRRESALEETRRRDRECAVSRLGLQSRKARIHHVVGELQLAFRGVDNSISRYPVQGNQINCVPDPVICMAPMP